MLEKCKEKYEFFSISLHAAIKRDHNLKNLMKEKLLQTLPKNHRSGPPESGNRYPKVESRALALKYRLPQP